MVTCLAGGTVFLDGRLTPGLSVFMENGRILDVREEDGGTDVTVDVSGCIVAPGFIDLHTHGAGGFDFADGEVSDVLSAARVHGAHGTTTLCPTAPSLGKADTLRCLKNVRRAMEQNGPGRPFLAGSHLEGPCFAPSQKGAQDPRVLRNPDPRETKKWLKASAGTLLRVSFAPELPGADELLATLNEAGVLAAYAHTEATYEELLPFIKKGCRIATHLYSGMNGVTRKGAARVLGGVETAFLEEEVTAEIIGDGIHLPPPLLLMIYKILGPSRLCLVTDSMRSAGMPEGPSVLGPKKGGVDCVIRDGVAYMPEGDSYAGSVATADRLLRTAVQAGIPLSDALTMLTETPARTLGLSDRGTLRPGSVADVCVLSPHLYPQKVFFAGEELRDEYIFNTKGICYGNPYC